MKREPSAPIPSPLRSDVPGTWAYDTMSKRIREDILARVFRENSFPPEIVLRLQEVDKELQSASTTQLSALENDGGPDVEHWNSVILEESLRNGETWLSAPWVIAEFYFYRRILTAIRYFHDDRVDPFATQKSLGLSSASGTIDSLATRVNEIFNNRPAGARADFVLLLLTSLWGNRIDLSIWPVGSEPAVRCDEKGADEMSVVLESSQRFILADDTDAVANIVYTAPKGSRFDIIVDNAGFELFSDLCLADFLAHTGMALKVFIHLKAHPTFVSDAMTKDVLDTVEFLRASSNSSDAEQMGNRWSEHIAQGRWELVEDFFWVQPSPMWEMPESIAQELAKSALIIVKGDANYRRLLGDRQWAFNTPFADVVSYFPAPTCALRTLKAEIGCGIPDTTATRIAQKDNTWLVSGKYAVVHLGSANVSR